MQSPRDGFDLSAELRAMRPEPLQEFGARLDARVAAGFPRAPRSGRLPLTALATRLRVPSLKHLTLAASGMALLAIVVATAMIATDRSDQRIAIHTALPRQSQHDNSASPEVAAGATTAPKASGAVGHGEGSSSVQFSTAEPTTAPGAPVAGLATHAAHREVERSAEIGLLADPSDVDGDSAKVFEAVHDAGGIVLHSTTTTGRHAGARFELLIPSARLGDALAAFSAIDEVRSRHEATADITAPTAAAGEKLRDSQAKIDGLLSRLAAAETESEAAALEVELRAERRQKARLRSHLVQLHRRADYTRVDLRIETGASPSGSGGWGIGDAFRDAGHILGIAAGVILVGLAVLSPFALLCLLAWLAFLAWRRGQRGRALRGA